MIARVVNLVFFMSSNIVKVQVTDDYMAKVSRSLADKAICEVIWNALDADADQVNVIFPQSGLLPGSKKIQVVDNGSGINWNHRGIVFGNLGGSWKKGKVTTSSGRKLHGSEGHGRFKSYALGRYVRWMSTYQSSDNELFSFDIVGKSETPTDFQFGNHCKQGNSTGVVVEIDELSKQFEWLEAPQILVDKIAPVFSLYLKNNPTIKIKVEDIYLDPSFYIKEEVEINLEDIFYLEKKYPLSLKIIEWTEAIGLHKEIFLCAMDSVPLEEYDKKIRSLGEYSFTAYISSDLFRELNHQNLLGLNGLSVDIIKKIEESIKAIKLHFKQKKINANQHLFESWRKEGVYPYSSVEIVEIDQGSAPVKKAEKELFEILAITIRESLPDFDSDSIKTKKFQLHMLRQAVESGDTTLKRIFKEVLNLPDMQQKELAQLLEDSSLSNMIKVSKEISERIKIIDGLEEIIYDKNISKHVKERSQLHKILADNTWIFGEQYNLTVNDQSLTKVLESYLNTKGITDLIVDRPVERVDGSKGIVDLMFTRSLGCSNPKEYSYLVIELKRPSEHIGQKQYRQVEDYQIAIVNDPRFNTVKSNWEFWIIGDGYGADNHVLTKMKDTSTGIVDQNTSGNISYVIKAVTWSMLFAQAKHRLDFLKRHLDINASKEDSLIFLKEKYAEYTSAIVIDED